MQHTVVYLHDSVHKYLMIAQCFSLHFFARIADREPLH